MATFGGNLRRARKRADLSSEALAQKAGLHRNTVPLIESGQSEPRLDTILALAKALDIDPCELLKGL